MRRYLVRGVARMPVIAIVTASSPEQAKSIAKKRRVGLRERSIDGWEVSDPAGGSGDAVEIESALEGG